MSSTDQAGATGRTSEQDGHYHDGSWYFDTECRCALSTSAQPCGLDECDCADYAR